MGLSGKILEIKFNLYQVNLLKLDENFARISKLSSQLKAKLKHN